MEKMDKLEAIEILFFIITLTGLIGMILSMWFSIVFLICAPLTLVLSAVNMHRKKQASMILFVATLFFVFVFFGLLMGPQ